MTQLSFATLDHQNKKKRAARSAGVYWGVKDQRKPRRQLLASQKKRNRRNGSIRARVEHVFRVVKCQFSYRARALPWHRQERRSGVCTAGHSQIFIWQGDSWNPSEPGA